MDIPVNHDPSVRARLLLTRMRGLVADIEAERRVILKAWDREQGAAPQLENLADYLALRHHDLRDLQRELMALGLSSLGRLESRVMPTLNAVMHALGAMSGDRIEIAPPAEQDFFAGESALAGNSDLLFGTPPANRRGRIMVTLPSEAAADRALLADLARAGMDIARINCAHDDAEAWRRMCSNIHEASAVSGRRISILMDIAGSKIRIDKVNAAKGERKMLVGDCFRLVAEGEPEIDEKAPRAATVSLPDIVRRLKSGDRVRYDDGKMEAVVEETDGERALLRIVRVKEGGIKLKAEKGINLPDTDLGLSPLTAKDETDLLTVTACADMIGYSFVSRPEDIDLFEEALRRAGVSDPDLGLIAKIEHPDAVRNLPALIARAHGKRPFGIMIARGDLAAEIGFERLAEMQEELLWIAEAASVPVIWATQVLEDLVKDGVPSRGEMTDAVMAARAECVMLNKGPAIVEAVRLLDRLFSRMDEHMFKKTARLRALRSW